MADLVDPISKLSRSSLRVSSLTNRSERAVAYIKYNKASAAALAIEHLHEAVLNDGRGPTLKVMLAEAPQAR